jgi:hypothetical protein
MFPALTGGVCSCLSLHSPPLMREKAPTIGHTDIVETNEVKSKLVEMSERDAFSPYQNSGHPLTPRWMLKTYRGVEKRIPDLKLHSSLRG